VRDATKEAMTFARLKQEIEAYLQLLEADHPSVKNQSALKDYVKKANSREWTRADLHQLLRIVHDDKKQCFNSDAGADTKGEQICNQILERVKQLREETDIHYPGEGFINTRLLSSKHKDDVHAKNTSPSNAITSYTKKDGSAMNVKNAIVKVGESMMKQNSESSESMATILLSAGALLDKQMEYEKSLKKLKKHTQKAEAAKLELQISQNHLNEAMAKLGELSEQDQQFITAMKEHQITKPGNKDPPYKCTFDGKPFARNSEKNTWCEAHPHCKTYSSQTINKNNCRFKAGDAQKMDTLKNYFE